MLFREERKIEQQLDKYGDLLRSCIESFKSGIEHYFEDCASAEFEHYVDRTHSIESDMDNLRREIAFGLYNKTLLPDSRGDILILLELADKMPNAMESILFSMQCEALSLPKEIMPDLRILSSRTYDILQLAASSFKAVFDDKPQVMRLAEKIDEDESFCDTLERRILKSVFSLDIDCGEKVLLKSFINELGDISDHAEHLSDNLVIMSVKGQI